MAYGHMRASLGREPGERGQLRVPVYVWLRYVQARFDRGLQHALPKRPGLKDGAPPPRGTRLQRRCLPTRGFSSLVSPDASLDPALNGHLVRPLTLERFT